MAGQYHLFRGGWSVFSLTAEAFLKRVLWMNGQSRPFKMSSTLCHSIRSKGSGCFAHYETYARRIETYLAPSSLLNVSVQSKLPLEDTFRCQMRHFSKSILPSQGVFFENMTVGECKYKAEQLFCEHSVPESSESAAYIIAFVFGHKTLSGIEFTQRLTFKEIEVVEHLTRLRLARLPIQYVIGEWDFRNLTLDMRPPVHIPRPETEELVEHILSDETFSRKRSFLEVGPGSGAIVCSLLKECPEMTGVAVDISQDACNLTAQNAEKVGVMDRIEIHHLPIHQYASLCEMERFEFLVSNPPYLKSADMKMLQPEVICFEGHVGLHGGEDGLDVIKDILQVAPRILKPGGSVWLKVDIGQPQLVKELVAPLSSFLSFCETITDSNKLPRFCRLEVKHNPTQLLENTERPT